MANNKSIQLNNKNYTLHISKMNYNRFVQLRYSKMNYNKLVQLRLICKSMNMALNSSNAVEQCESIIVKLIEHRQICDKLTKRIMFVDNYNRLCM